MHKGILLCLAIGFLVFSITGCATYPKAGGGAGLEEEASLIVAGRLRFDDIPIPGGFRVLPDKSFIFQDDYTRVGILRYDGRANPELVVAFYREQMPLYGWSTLNIVECGQRFLNFEKVKEQCVVTIAAKGSRISLVVSVTPRGSVSATSRAPKTKTSE